MLVQLIAHVQLLANVTKTKALVLLVSEALGAGDLGVPVAPPVLLAVAERVVGHRVFVTVAGGVAAAGLGLAAGGRAG